MRKTVFVILVMMGTTLHAYAKKVAGVIIFPGGAEEVTFNIPFGFLGSTPSWERLQYRVRYIDAEGKKQTLSPDQALEIRFAYAGFNYRMLSRLNTIRAGSIFSANRNIFLKLEMDGELKLFNYYYKQHSGGGYGAGGFSGGTVYTVDNFLFQKGDEPLKEIRGISFKKDMTQYFSDCPDLVDRIAGKDLRRRDVEAIVMFYNQHCGGI